MSSTINASTASGGGVITTADASGILQLQTAGVTGLTIDASQNVTLAKGLTVGASAAPAFSAYMSTATQSIATATFTKILINTKEFDTNSNYDNATNYRFTPTVAGYYQVNGQLSWGNGASATLITTIYKNGVRFKDGNNMTYTGGAYGVVSALIYLNGSTDYVELWGYQTTGSALNVNGNTQYYTYFQAFLARSA